jgi:molybdenum cofactor synthesis domain-containing protein
MPGLFSLAGPPSHTVSDSFQSMAAILTISDSASINPPLDVSGPTISDILLAHGIRVLHVAIVPDDASLIQSTVQSWSLQDDVDWIITTGGTGFGTRDVTPEVGTMFITGNPIC